MLFNHIRKLLKKSRLLSRGFLSLELKPVQSKNICSALDSSTIVLSWTGSLAFLNSTFSISANIFNCSVAAIRKLSIVKSAIFFSHRRENRVAIFAIVVVFQLPFAQLMQQFAYLQVLNNTGLYQQADYEQTFLSSAHRTSLTGAHFSEAL